MQIRQERSTDSDAIASLVKEAFVGHPHSRNTEHLIVAELRKSGTLTLSLVAEVDGEVVGHVAFSPVRFGEAFEGWYGLGPVAVTPKLQKRGIGGSLIEMGLEVLRASDALGCVLVGEPAYYSRFGFVAAEGAFYEGVPPQYFLILPFADRMPAGEVHFDKAFSVEP